MKETKKQKWQRYATENNVTFQQNDTIKMLVNSIAFKLEIKPSKDVSDINFEKVVESKLMKRKKDILPKKSTTKGLTKISEKETLKKADKNTSKKIVTHKKKQITSKPKVVIKKVTELDKKVTKVVKQNTKKKIVEKTKTNNIEIPSFKDMQDMKIFCVKTGLNLLKDYIKFSKSKKVKFLSWIEKNISNAKTIDTNIPTKKIEKQIITTNTKEDNKIDEKQEMISYGNTLISTFKNFHLVKIHGSMRINDAKNYIATSCTPKYDIEFVNFENKGYKIIISDDNNKITLPKKEYLSIFH